MRELVRYIHLNPLRAGVVDRTEDLVQYAYAGHSAITGACQRPWQDTRFVLLLFGKRVASARKRYLQYVGQGVSQGHRDDLTGGGLIRSTGGWTRVRALRRKGVTFKGDERILGDSHFVTAVLAQARENLDKQYALAAKGIDFDRLLSAVASYTSQPRRQILTPSKVRRRVKARSLLCFWAVRDLGLTMTDLAVRLNQTVAAVSIAVQRGEQLAHDDGLRLDQLIDL